MKKIRNEDINDIKPGVSLAYDLKDDAGNQLLSAGVVLTDAHLAQLKRRGITSVPVETEELLSDEQKAEIRNEIIQKTSVRFRNVKDEPQMKMLMDLIVDYRLNMVQ